MTAIEAIILGLIQGLTEFLPVSSSGHLTIGKDLFGIETTNLAFEVTVHAATVLSTLVAFRKEIIELLIGLFKFKLNSETIYISKIVVSMIPVLIVGLFFKDTVEGIFGSGLLVVGIMLLLTSFLLFISEKIKPKAREIGYKQAFIIGIAQAAAVLPGLSRSGSTIATGLLLGVEKSKIAKFSFLMVIVPILGQAFLEIIGGGLSGEESGLGFMPLALGFISAFISGLFACNFMVNMVRKSKLTGFSIYCAVVGVICILSIIF